MPYECEIVRLQRQPVASVRIAIRPEQIAATLAEILPEVFAWLQARGIEMSGRPFSRYHSRGEEAIDFEAGLPVAEAIAGEARIRPSELPGGELARTVHMGPYDRVGAAYEALAAWLEGRGRKPAGAPWESYITDPEQEPDPSRWRTDVYWPLT